MFIFLNDKKNKKKHEQNKNRRSFKNLRNFLRNSHYNTENDGDCFFSPLEIQAVKKNTIIFLCALINSVSGRPEPCISLALGIFLFLGHLYFSSPELNSLRSHCVRCPLFSK